MPSWRPACLWKFEHLVYLFSGQLNQNFECLFACLLFKPLACLLKFERLSLLAESACRKLLNAVLPVHDQDA